MQNLLELYLAKEPKAAILGNQILTEILSLFLLDSFVLTNESYQIPELILSIKRYIEKNFASAPSLDQLAHIYGISKYHLSREFKKYIGVTIHQYLLNLQISYAKELLNYTSDSIEEICYNCGFNYSSHFIERFRFKEGMTPYEYRNKWKNK